MQFTLEKYKAFPYVAWTLFIGFAAFVGNLSLELYAVTSELAEASQELQQVTLENSARLDTMEEQIDSLSGRQ